MAGEALKYKFGLVNVKGQYLTMESFGNKVNANGVSLKKKQVWTLEQDEDYVYLKSFIGRYLATNKNRDVSGDSEERGENEKFEVEVQDNGKWALKSAAYSYYLSGIGDDRLTCTTKGISDSELWTLHLDVHPQVCIKSVQRKKYVHLEKDSLKCNEDVPWGSDAVVTLVFNSGRYALRAANGSYLSRDGRLVPDVTNDSLFVIAFKAGNLALRDCKGLYLSPQGNDGVLQCKKNKIGKDEQFVLEDSPPQGVFFAYSGKLASTRQGIDVSANQLPDSEEGFTDKETFQLEYIKGTSPAEWAIRTVENDYWIQVSNGGIRAEGRDRNKAACHFQFEYHDGKIAIKASNGKYVMAKPAGHLYATSDSVGEIEKFTFQFINRPLIALKSEHGYIAAKGSGKLESNRANSDIFQVKFEGTGYHIQDANGAYWAIDADAAVILQSGTPTVFNLEFQGNSKLCIRSPNGKYLRAEQNGSFKANGEAGGSGTLLEF